MLQYQVLIHCLNLESSCNKYNHVVHTQGIHHYSSDNIAEVFEVVGSRSIQNQKLGLNDSFQNKMI
jgi:hypothetical protein